jgi:adenosylcobinamide-GDP ribazoletransferase
LKNYLRALSFLTVIPLPFVRFDQGGRELTDAAAAFPLAGATLGLIQAVLAWLLLLILPPGSVAVLMLLTGFLLTRGLHLDGLADTADGLIGAPSREKAIKAMADSAIGVMGAAVLFLFYLFKFSLLTDTAHLLPVAVFFMPLAGRWAIVFAGSLFGPAREEGLGDLFLRSLNLLLFLKASLGAALLLTVLFWLLPLLILPVLTGCAAALIGALLLALYANQRLGGLTGDILGAASEIGEALFLLCFYLFLKNSNFADALLQAVNPVACII